MVIITILGYLIVATLIVFKIGDYFFDKKNYNEYE